MGAKPLIFFECSKENCGRGSHRHIPTREADKTNDGVPLGGTVSHPCPCTEPDIQFFDCVQMYKASAGPSPLSGRWFRIPYNLPFSLTLVGVIPGGKSEFVLEFQ